MAADRYDRMIFLRVQPHIDAAVVIAVDEHHMLVGNAAGFFPTQHLLVEAAKRRAVLGLDHRQDICVDGLDDTRRILCGGFVHSFLLQLDPAHPVSPAARHDFRRLAARTLQQMTAILAQNEFIVLVRFGETEGGQKIDNLAFVRRGIFLLP